MRQHALRAAMATLLLAPAVGLPAETPEIAELRAMLSAMQSDYEQRIAALEARLAAAERAAAEPGASTIPEPDNRSRPMTAPTPVRAGSPHAHTHSGTSGLGAFTSANAFNPQISVTLDGNYYHDGLDGDGSALVGQALQAGVDAHGHGHDHEDAHADAHGHAHGLADNGFNFREAEIAFSATVDPYFDAAVYLSVDGDGNLELEEGYFQTRSLPYGLRVKGGKFLSDFGYVNRQHPHAWDFVDQNLPYLNLLGVHGLQDTGLQLTWLPDLPVYTLFGLEALQGDQEVFGATLGDEERDALGLEGLDDGPRLLTAFAKVAPDIGRNHALQLGVSYAHARQHQAELAHTHDDEHDHEVDGHDEPLEPEVHLTGLEGDADLWGLDLVYKRDGGGAHGQGDFKLQTEYLRSIRDMKIRASAHPEQIGARRTFTTDGLYAQAVYGFAPRWTAGLRYDVLGLTNEVSGGHGDDLGSSDRWTLNLTWNLSEFSLLRAQYARSDILVAEDERERFDAFYLQFLMSLGAHGAHAF